MPKNSRGTWVQVFTGNPFFPVDPRPDEIFVEDIAHALAYQCRFGGHIKGHYSVASHSVYVSHTCDPKDALWGLLHDASEAYLYDVARPLKKLPEFEGYRKIEKHLMDVICDKFGLLHEMPASVKRADDNALATEHRDLMGDGIKAWTDKGAPAATKLDFIPAERAEQDFLQRLAELYPAFVARTGSAKG